VTAAIAVAYVTTRRAIRPEARPARPDRDVRDDEAIGPEGAARHALASRPQWPGCDSGRGSAGRRRLARRHGLAAWWVGSDGRLEMTAAARPQTAWLAGEAD